MVRLEDEEAFTALLQNLDEDKKRLLDQFIQVTKDYGLIEALLLSFEEAIRFFQDPGLSRHTLLQDTYYWGVKRCFKGILPVYVDYSPDEPRLTLTQFLKIISMLLLVNNPETQALRIHYPHTSVPEHARQVVAEGKAQIPKNGDVFDNSDAKLLFDVLSNPNHQHRQRAVQLVRRFGAAVEKEKAQDSIKEQGIMMEQASRKYGVPASTLQDWKEMGLIPALYKGKSKQGVYLDEEAVARAAAIYQEARQKGIQPTRLLKAELAQQAERRPQLDQGITASSASREFNVPTHFFLRWAKQLGVIPILSEGTGQGSATYLDREKAREMAELYHEAKRQKIQPKKLLERLSSE